MVHVVDVGSEVDAPVATVWKYLASGAPHSAAHRSIRNRQSTAEGPSGMVATMERNWRGQWVRVVNRLTLFPPVGYVVEVLEGPCAGSKMFNVYVPRGAKTGIEVYGDFVFPGLGAADVPAAAMEWLTTTFDEDAPAIAAFARASP